MPLLLANEVRLRGPGLLPTLGDWGTRRNGEGGIRPRAGLLNWSTFKMPALGLRWAPKTAELPAPGAAAAAMPVSVVAIMAKLALALALALAVALALTLALA